MESVLLTTTDGIQLEADLAVASPGSPEQRTPGVVVCHPHPHYGGDRHNSVVEAVFRHLHSLGCTTMRFDFRAEFGDGLTERLDVVAALDDLAVRVDGPLFVVGYSFGAAVALTTADERPAGIVAIAPPLAVMEVPAPSAPVLVLTPAHDEFTDPDAARPIGDAWPDAEFRVIEATNHFLTGRVQEVAEVAGAWICARG